MKSALLPLLLLAAACGSAPPYPAYSIEEDAEQISQVLVADSSLQDVVRAGQPLVERMAPEDNLRVIVPIRNIDDEEIRIMTQFDFRDAQRRPLPDETNRQVLVLPGGTTKNVEAISRSRRAADFVLRLSWDK